MSLRCSLLGHTYGEAEIEREREEQGSEVVVTVREFEECERCGERSVISENKEVTALESPAPDLERAESDESADADVEATPADGDAEVMTAASTGTDGADDASSPAIQNEFETQSADEDDGVILDDEEEEEVGDVERGPGEWPDADTTHPAEADAHDHAEWPEVGREDEGFDAEPDADTADVEFGGGLAPESTPEVDDDEDVEFVNADGDALQATDADENDSELSAGITANSEAPTLSGPADDPDVDAEFVCPECDYRDGVSGSSLRAGDICPECRRGYLARE